jgi:hypothetical protein
LLYADAFDQLKAPSGSAAGHYNLTLSEVSAVGYTLTAKPTAGGKQVGDTACAVLKLVVQRGSNTRSAVDGAGGDSTTRCWPQ